MKSVQFIIVLIFLSISLQVNLFAQQKNKKPNIILIMVDDMNDWVGYLDGYEGEIHTPNIDRLAHDGMAFKNAHISAPSCTPSRISLMLGKLTSTTGLYGNDQWWKPVYPEQVSMPQYFRDSGYYTAGAGKVFHHTPGHNPPVSWDEFQDQVFDGPWNFTRSSPENYWLSYGYRGPMVDPPNWFPLHGLTNVRPPLDWGAIPEKREQDYGDLQVVKYAQKFLKKSYDKPFFLALGIYKPHIPWYVPQKYFDQYPLDEIVLPKVKENDLEDVPTTGKKFAGRGSNDIEEIFQAGKWRDAVQGYLASISFADAQAGAILKALEDSDYLKNTIVVFWSDHGFHLGEKNHWHKWTLWEESTQIPFIIKAPGVTTSGSSTNESVGDINLFPTLISLAGLPKKKDLEGHDLSPILKNPNMEWQYPAITVNYEGNAAVRSRHWRYIRYADGGEELYDHRKDPYEWKNLADKEEYMDVIEKHRKWLPETFKDPSIIGNRDDWFFDPHDYTWLHRETGKFIDGKE